MMAGGGSRPSWRRFGDRNLQVGGPVTRSVISQLLTAARTGHIRDVWDHAPMDDEVVPVLRVASAADAVAWYERLGWPARGSIASSLACLRSYPSLAGKRGCFFPSTGAMPGRTP